VPSIARSSNGFRNLTVLIFNGDLGFGTPAEVHERLAKAFSGHA
jgi:hypothetical protein